MVLDALENAKKEISMLLDELEEEKETEDKATRETLVKEYTEQGNVIPEKYPFEMEKFYRPSVKFMAIKAQT